MIWSIIPTELIFAAVPANENKAEPISLIQYYGRSVTVRGGRLEALLSSDPQDYLDQRFRPGSLLNQAGRASDGASPR